MKKFLLPFFVVLSIISIAGNVLAYFRYSGSRPLITVNGQAITRKQMQDRVDYLYAKSLLSGMIWQTIVEQAAEKANCMPTESDVDSAMAMLDRTNPSVIENARKTDPDLQMFKEELKSNLALRNLRMIGITVSPQDIQNYYDTNKQRFQLPQQTQTTLVFANDRENADTAQRLLQNGVSTSIIAQQPGLGVVGVNVKLTQALPSYIGEAVLGMKPGDVKEIPVGSTFAIVKAKTVLDQDIPPLNAISDQVRIACILAKAPSEVDVLERLRSSAQIIANVGKYAAAIPDDPSTTSDDGTSTSQ